ncbi:MAG: LCP family protein [Acidimicrobiia bacterium]|nr:LCP family protein [Acidimicrobiia bacterium]
MNDVFSTTWGRWTARILSMLLGVALAAGFTTWRAFQSIGQVEFNVPEARSVLAEMSVEEREETARLFTEEEAARLAEELAATEEAILLEQLALAEAEGRVIEEVVVPYTNPAAVSPPLPDGMFDAYLLIGADESGRLADAIILVLEPTDGSATFMVSLPRDLYIPNPCAGRYSRINANLGGCRGVAGGTTLLSWAVETYTGIKVDHFALVNFAGFAAVVDAVGGVPLCFDYPTRDDKSGLNVAAGCQTADGATALAWVRSRRTEQLVDDVWVSLGASDFTRQRREQDLLFLVASRLNSFSSLGSFQAVVDSVAGSVRLDSAMSFAGAVGLAWEHRGLTASQVTRLSIPVENYRTGSGALVLVPTRSFNAVLSAAYPPAAR